MNIIRFTNNNQLAFDNLGEQPWIAPAICATHDQLLMDEVGMDRFVYDGYTYESPYCKRCRAIGLDGVIVGVPVDDEQRAALIAKHPQRSVIEEILKSLSECPDRITGHRYIPCDEWSATCTCGATEGNS